jgi:hypothetical protein
MAKFGLSPRIIPKKMMLKTCGRLAQLVEHCVHIAGVTGSSPVPPPVFL